MAINESDAFKIYDALKAGQIPDEMKPRAVSFLSAYRSENVKKMQDIFTNLQTLDKEDGSFITADRFSPGLGDQMRKREANILWLANRYNRPTTEVRGKYDVFKADASTIWNAGTLDDEAFFNKASEQVGIQKKKIDILNSAQEASFKSAVSLGDEVADFAAWQASIKDPEAFSDDAKNAWDDAKQKTLDRLGADGLGLADRIVRTLRHEQGISTEPDAWINQTVEMLTQLKVTDPDKYDLVKSVAIAKGEKSEKPQSDIAAGAIESFARTSADIIAGTPRYLTKIGAEGAALLAKSGITNAENPELLAARATAKPEVIDDLKDIARGVIDPIESRRKGWAKHAENTVYSIAGSLPTLASVYIPGGQGALTGMFANESYEYFRRAGWSGPDALIASFGSGRIQAAAETASEVIGKIPWFAQWMSKYGVQPGMSFVKNWLTRTTVRGGVETAEEVFQQATSPAIQELLSSAIDNIPDLPEGQKLKDVMLELAKQENAIPLLLTSLSLGAVGASVSTTNDIAIAAAITRNPRLLRAVMSEADARKIEQEQDPAVRSEMIKKAWVATPKEQIISNIQKIVNEDGKAVEQSKSVLAEAEQMQMIPKIRRDDQGWKVEKNGQMVRVASREAAVKMAYSSLDDYAKTMHENMAVVADDLIGKKEAIEISTKAQTLEDEIREGRLSPVEAAQRAELSAKMSGMTPEQAQKARWLVMGKNNIETIDNVRTAVSRIFGGANVITVMHEHAHGRFAVALRDGYVTHDEGVSWVRLAEGATGLEFLPTKDDSQVTPTMLDEAIVEVISADNVGRRKEDTRFTPGAISRGIAASLRLNKRNVIGERQKGKMTDEGLSKYKAFMDSYREFWGVVLRNAKALQKARKEGKLGDNYQDFLDKVMNVDMSTQQEAMTAKEAVDIVEGNPALSIRRATEMASEMRNDPAMIRKIDKWNADRAKLGKNLEEADDEFFNVFWPELMKASGQRLKPSMRNINEAASRASEDIIQWLKENPKYLNYYAEDWQTTRDVLNIVFDNFTNDEFTGFRLITGLTSPATPLRGNLADAVQVMNLWKTKGNLDELELEISEKGNRKVKDGGPFKLQSNTGANKIFTLKVIEDLFSKFGSWDSVNQFLQEPVSSKELHAFKKQMGYAAGVAKIGQIERVVKEATGQEDLIPRMFIFGPKVGAYTLNAVGDSRYTTTDIWESRFIRSYFPEMFKAGTGLPTGDMEHEIFQSFASAFKTKIESLMGENFEPSALQAVRWFYMIFKTREAGYAYGNTAGTISDYAKLAAEQYLGFTFVDNQSGRSGVAGSQAGIKNIPSERGVVQGENLAGVSGVPQVSGTTEERFSLRQRGGMGGDIGGLSAQGSQDIKSKVTPLEGLPSKIKVDGIYVTFGPFEKARLAAEKYVKDVGLDYRPPTKYVKVDEKRASRIAKAYDEMQHDPNDPAVKASYEALAKETLAQYEALKSTGISIEPIQGKDPYGNPRNAIIDVIENNHLWFTPTTGAFGGSASASIDVSGNPLLAETGETINGYKMLVNDVFRIVHDYFGHIKEGVGFRADGEENAWMSHAVMYSDLARPAMTTETRGQNSWVNFGPFGEFNKTASAEETQYAPQKTGLLPNWVMEEGLDEAFVTTGNSTTSYSLANRSLVSVAEDIIAAKMAKPEYKERFYSEARTRLANIRAKQGDVIPNEATKRDRQMAALRTLDAILAAFPPEIRGKVGGFVRMADMRTDKARQKELDHRLNILERYVENDAKKYYGEKMDKLIERARPKKEAGKKPKGKLGADVHDLFDTIEQAMEWTSEKADAHAEALESVIAGGTLTPEQEAHDMLEAQAVRLVAGWKDAQSAQREAAVKELTAVYENAYIEAKKLVILKRQLRDKQRSELIVATGKEGKASERDDREIKDAGTGFLFKSRSGFLTFKQVMRWAFGDLPIAKSIAERERIASNTMEDSIESKMNGIESLFKFLAGSTYKGEQLRWEMSQKSIEVDGRKLSQFEAIAATMMWMQEDGRRHMIGNLDETGKLISKWHYNQKFVDAIEAKLSNEAKAVRTFLLNEYAQEWQSLNGVYSKLNGINLPNIPLYSPITVTPIQVKGNQMIDPVTGSVMSGASTTPGSLKSRSGKIAEPVFRDALKTYIAHTKQIEHWKAYAELLEDSRALFGDRNVLNAIEAASGLNGKSVIGGWIDYFAEGGNREAAAFLEFSQGVDRITSRAAGMALIGRIGTIFIQATQLAAAAAKIPFGAYTVRLGKLFAGQLDYSAAFNSAFIQRRIKQQPPLVQEAMKGLLAKKPSKVKQAQRELGKLISGADGLFTAGTFAIVYDYNLKQAKNMGLNAQAADDYAMKITEQIVDEIAQPTRPGARSLLENRLTGWGARLAWAFASESRKNLGLMLAESQDGITNSRFARAAFYVVILNSIASWIIRSAWNDAKDKEDDELFDERNWNLNRLAITVGTDWAKGVPLFGDMLQAGAFAVAGEYQPEGNLLSGASRGVKAGLKLAERLNEDGVVDGLLSTDTVNDADLILSAMGLTNDNIAAAASIAHLLKDVTKIVGN